jgi:hypothetical protein
MPAAAAARRVVPRECLAGRWLHVVGGDADLDAAFFSNFVAPYLDAYLGPSEARNGLRHWPAGPLWMSVHDRADPSGWLQHVGAQPGQPARPSLVVVGVLADPSVPARQYGAAVREAVRAMQAGGGRQRVVVRGMATTHFAGRKLPQGHGCRTRYALQKYNDQAARAADETGARLLDWWYGCCADHSAAPSTTNSWGGGHVLLAAGASRTGVARRLSTTGSPTATQHAPAPASSSPPSMLSST